MITLPNIPLLLFEGKKQFKFLFTPLDLNMWTFPGFRLTGLSVPWSWSFPWRASRRHSTGGAGGSPADGRPESAPGKRTDWPRC